MAARSWVLAGGLGLVIVGATPCPWLSPLSFQLPGVFTQWAPDGSGGYTNIDGGIQIIDITGDSLVDLLYGYDDGSASSYECIYINTQCGWVLQENYTGPVNECMLSRSTKATTLPTVKLAAGHVDVLGVRYPLGVTVGEFSAAVEGDTNSPAGTAQVKTRGGGIRHSNLSRMDQLADEGGFDVYVRGKVVAQCCEHPA